MSVDIIRIAGNGNGFNLRRVYYDGVEMTGYPEATSEIHRLIGQGIDRLCNGTLQRVTIEHVRTGQRRHISKHSAVGALQLFIYEG